MNNYMKTIISGLKQWVSSQKSDWNQNDSSAANFIKNRPFYSEEKEKILFSGNIPVENFWDDVYGAGELAYGLSFTIGQIYKITFDNVEYSCECFSLQGSAFGNASIVTEGVDSGEPFFIGYNDDWGLCLYCLTEGTHSLSISGTVEEVHQIDKKFVPIPDLADVAHTGDYDDLRNTPYIPWDTVRYASSQSLTDGNKQLARNNIGASGATNLLNGSKAFSLRSSNANETIGTGSIAFGVGAKASGNYSYAIGHYTEASDYGSHAEGGYTEASGEYSHAEGRSTVASGEASHAEGDRTTAFGSSSHAEGHDTMASGSYSHAEGYGNVTSITLTGDAGVVEYTTSATDASSYKGCKFIYNGQLFTVINTSGSIVTLDKTLSSTENINELQLKAYESYASGGYSHAEGYNTIASGDCSHAEGGNTIASGDFSHAEGTNTIASVSEAHAEGRGTIASSIAQHVQGRFNIESVSQYAYGKYAHIVGNGESDSARSNAHTLDWNGVGWFAGGLKVGGTSQDDPNAKEVAFKSDIDGIATNLVNGSAPNSLRSVSAASEDSSYSLGQCAFAIGSSTKASGNYSHAEGNYTYASGSSSHAEGYNTTASGNYSHAEGYQSKASNANTHAEGWSSVASGDYSHAEGSHTIAASAGQHAEGKYNIQDSANKYAHIVGNGSSDTARSNAHTLDWNGVGWFKGGLKVGGTSQDDTNAKEVALKSDLDSISFSEATTSTAGLMSAADKSKLDGIATGATAIKNLKDGSDNGSLRISTAQDSLGSYAIALGYNSEASGAHSVTLGQQTKATNDNSYAEGYNTTASGSKSHAEGSDTIASGNYSHAEGSDTIASGRYSHAEGKGNYAFGESSHAEGHSSFLIPDTITSSSTNDEIIESWKNNWFGMAKGNSSHSEGKDTLALSDSSHAEGYQTIASGIYSHAEGDQTIASGYSSHAEGYQTKALRGHSHAEGSNTIASSYYQHVQGQYNIEDSANKYAHIVGNGDSDARSNAHTLDWSGNAWFAGNIYIGGTGQNDATAVKVAIVPFPTAADEGKILRVINGAPTWIALPNAEEASF